MSPFFCSQFTVSNSSNANYSVQLFLVQLHGILGHLIYFSLERQENVLAFDIDLSVTYQPIPVLSHRNCYLINASQLSCVILKVIYYSGDCRPTVVLTQLR